MTTIISDTTNTYSADADTQPHAYNYTNGQLTTEVVTMISGHTLTKTYTWTGTTLTAESGWVYL